MSDGKAYPANRYLGSFAALSDSNQPSLRFQQTQQMPDGAIAWVSSENAHFHFERYSTRPDDDATVITGFNGGRWIKGVGQGARLVGHNYTAASQALAAFPNYADIGSANVNSVQTGDLLLILFWCSLSSGGQPDLTIRIRVDGASWRPGPSARIVNGGSLPFSYGGLLTVGEAPTPDPPSDPLPIVVQGCYTVAACQATRREIVVLALN